MRATSIAICCEDGEAAFHHRRLLTLAGFEARCGLVDDVDAALAAHQLIVTMATLERLKRILDLHCRNRSIFWPKAMKNAPKRARQMMPVQ